MRDAGKVGAANMRRRVFVYKNGRLLAGLTSPLVVQSLAVVLGTPRDLRGFIASGFSGRVDIIMHFISNNASQCFILCLTIILNN